MPRSTRRARAEVDRPRARASRHEARASEPSEGARKAKQADSFCLPVYRHAAMRAAWRTVARRRSRRMSWFLSFFLDAITARVARLRHLRPSRPALARAPGVRMLAIVAASSFVLHGASRAAVGVRRAAGPSAGADASVGVSGTLKLLVLAPAEAVARTAAHGFPPPRAAHRCTPLHPHGPALSRALCR